MNKLKGRILKAFQCILMRKIFLIFTISLYSLASLRAQVVINELMAYNTSTIFNPVAQEYTDWIELRNTGTGNFDLTGCMLSDKSDNPDKWIFPYGTVLPGGAVMLIWADEEENPPNGYHASFKLNVAGEILYLSGTDGKIIDSLAYNRQFENISFGTDTQGRPSYFSNPTPGAANDYGSAYRLTFGIRYDPVPGIYQSAQLVNLSWIEPGAVIRYTLDGSEPNENSSIYTNNLFVNTNTVIRTRIWADGYLPGWTETATYIISPPFTLPVFSLVTDPLNLWDNTIGIYVEGTNGITGYCSETPKNYNQDWERPVSMEYFGRSDQRILQVDGGIKIHGGCSRGFNMKSLVFFARNEYGANELNYRFFDEKELDWFKALIFRNSGNDFQYTMFRDGAIQAIAKDKMDVDGQAFQQVLVFINGEYWGIHNLRERVNEHFISSNFNIPADDIDLLKSNWSVLSGDRVEYNKLQSYLQTHSLSVPANYQYVADRIDIDEYINYLITQMYFANTDWPGNNQKYWRQRSTNSKWRWVLFDVDFSMGIYDFNPAIDMFTFVTEENGPDWPNPPWSTFQIRKLFESEEFRDQFLGQYMMHLNTTFQPDRVIGVIDSLRDNIKEAFPAHIARWGEPWSMEQWEANIELLRTFARLRPESVWENMRRYFSLGSVIEIKLVADTGGMIHMNGYAVPDGRMNGRSFAGTPLDLQASPDIGNKFARWEVTPIETQQLIIVPRESAWKYHDQGTYPGDGWNTSGFDDSSWPTGMGELGYGDEDETTVISYGQDPDNKYMSYYFRHEFSLNSPVQCDLYDLQLLCDDGAVIYINGEEVLRANMPEGEINEFTPAITYIGGTDENTYFRRQPGPFQLKEGTNLIAVEIHQSSVTSSDIGFDLELAGKNLITGEKVSYTGSHLSLIPDEGLFIRAVFDTSAIIPALIINEFMASNQDAVEDDYGESADWIEVFNPGQDAVNIGGLYVTDDLGEPFKWQIPDGYQASTTIPAGGFIILYADGDTLQGPLHLGFKLDAQGEDIGLSLILNSIFHWIDKLTYQPQDINVSCGRYPDGTQSWYTMDTYTPGLNNILTSVNTNTDPPFTIDVYPNPAGDIAYLDIKGISTGTGSRIDVRLNDLTGRMLISYEILTSGAMSENIIDLSGIPAGMYILRVTDSIHQRSVRLVKQ
jgi:hypothetical protein